MTAQCVVVIDESLAAYDFGPQHPLSPQRVVATYASIRAHGLLEKSDVQESRITADISEAELLAIHASDYI